MNRTSLLVFAPAVLTLGCSEQGFHTTINNPNGVEPAIQVAPPSLTWGELSSGQRESQPFTVTNIGADNLEVSDIVFGTGSSFEITGETEFALAPDEQTEVQVTFSPQTNGDNFGRAVVLSNDPNTPEAPVDLLGRGAVPDLEITPSTYPFGESFIPCGDTVTLALANVGVEELVIDDFTYGSNLGQLSIVNEADLRARLPITLQPGQTDTLEVAYAAGSSGSDAGTLEVFSNDPARVEAAYQDGEGVFHATGQDTFTQPSTPLVDVMFLIDQSTSMSSNNADDIQDGIPPFLAELRAVADFHMIEVTRPDACANGGVIDANTPNAEQILIDNAFGVYSWGKSYDTEALLRHAANALAQTGPGQCNDGFLRPGALLHIIVASDERDQSGQSASFWLSDYQRYVFDPAAVTVSAVVDLSSGNVCGDGTGAAGYIDAAIATGGATLNICNASWGAKMPALATDSVDGVGTYVLTENADESSMTVTVNGIQTTDFGYDSASNSVTVESPEVADGDEVVIDYGVLATCD